MGGKRESSSDEEDESATCPATPVAGRRKRHRQWRWTIAPVGGSAECGAECEAQQDKRSDEPPRIGDEKME